MSNIQKATGGFLIERYIPTLDKLMRAALPGAIAYAVKRNNDYAKTAWNHFIALREKILTSYAHTELREVAPGKKQRMPMYSKISDEQRKADPNARPEPLFLEPEAENRQKYLDAVNKLFNEHLLELKVHQIPETEVIKVERITAQDLEHLSPMFIREQESEPEITEEEQALVKSLSRPDQQPQMNVVSNHETGTDSGDLHEEQHLREETQDVEANGDLRAEKAEL